MRVYWTAFFLLLPWLGFTQGRTGFYSKPDDRGSFIGLRAGINYSQTTVRAYILDPLAGMKPFTGFYMGAFFQKNLQPNLVYRIDGNFQLKGLRVINTSGNIGIRAKYYYVGFTPLLGVNLMRQLTVYVGPELNVMLAKVDEIGRNKYPIEAGATIRLMYSLRRVGAEIGYFRAFTPYDALTLGNATNTSFRNDFYNRNLQVGLLYRFN